jgi:hypothetical protein
MIRICKRNLEKNKIKKKEMFKVDINFKSLIKN